MQKTPVLAASDAVRTALPTNVEPPVPERHEQTEMPFAVVEGEPVTGVGAGIFSVLAVVADGHGGIPPLADGCYLPETTP